MTPTDTPRLPLTATDDPTAVSYAYDGGPGLRRIERRIYRVTERVTVIDERDEKPSTYRVHSVGVNVEDPADVDVYLIRQTKRGTDYVNGLGMWDGSRDIERFAADTALRPATRAFWLRLAEVLAAARTELATPCGRCGSPRSSARHWHTEGHAFEQAGTAS